MKHELPELPYAMDALAPHISRETLEFHYGKHHAAYVNKLNDLLPGSGFEDMTLEDIIRKAEPGTLFNNAAQTWNHTFYWHSLSPAGGKDPDGGLAAAIDSAFGSWADFKQQFTDMALGNFGSGWTWLVADENGGLQIVNTGNAGNPMQSGLKPLLTCDVWEHAYYIDYRNRRPGYLEAFWELVHCDFAAHNLAA